MMLRQSMKQKIFQDRITYAGYYKTTTAPRFLFKSYLYKVDNYEMTVKDFNNIAPRMEAGKLWGEFEYIKRGCWEFIRFVRHLSPEEVSFWTKLKHSESS